MSTATLNEQKYRSLLGKALPVVIRTSSEHKRLMKTFDQLMVKPDDKLTEEEGRLLQLLSVLLEEYEDRTFKLPKVGPGTMLRHLLEERRKKPSDLWEILPKSRVSDILSGRRAVSKVQAGKLAEFFRVPVDVFF